ncbi:MAG: hypothetical protein LBK57_02535 [Clostridiales Family XIII bacterium]|jgi:hypothetical protein|nr:hypothetical protein [Clostridiales Family XIII bacterium]
MEKQIESLWNIASRIEGQSCDLASAGAVLHEAVNYFSMKIEPRSFEADYLIMQQDHILNLFYAAENMLDMITKQNSELATGLYEYSKRIDCQ